jgi:TRAP-type C4-dicarboxylate transport system substrate-binding protein
MRQRNPAYLRSLTALAAVGLLSILAGSAFAEQSTTVKLATLVPERSVWGMLLKDLTEEWKTVTDGRVVTRIYPGGVAGDDPDIVRKMRIGQLQAATITVTGLSEIDDAFNVFSIPLFYESYDEYFHVLDSLEPVMRQRLEAKGFVFLHWGHGGWIHLFTTKPVDSVDDLRRLKLFVWAGSDRMVSWWKDNGFRPVPLALTDALPALQTGMIEALPSTPLAALSLQWYRQTPYMLDMGIAPLVGATVITKSAWNKIGPQDQEKILQASKRATETFAVEIPDQDASAITEMKQRGLTVNAPSDPATRQAWTDAAETFAAHFSNAFMPAEIYAMARKARDEFRSRQGTPNPDP